MHNEGQSPTATLLAGPSSTTTGSSKDSDPAEGKKERKAKKKAEAKQKKQQKKTEKAEAKQSRKEEKKARKESKAEAKAAEKSEKKSKNKDKPKDELKDKAKAKDKPKHKPKAKHKAHDQVSEKSERKRKNGKRSREIDGPPTPPRLTQAERADRHDLYQRSVQDCPADMDFLVRAHREAYGEVSRPLRFREDFCGTAAMCAEWVKRGEAHQAEGFDIDPECLQWGRERNLAPLGEATARITLHQEDVRAEGDAPADIRCAHNFSYQILEQRADLLEYFRRARAGLSTKGIFVLDLYGGSESFLEIQEEREIEDGAFTYTWEQRAFHPATGHTDCFIHFRFPDGSELPDAFSYTWRLYTPPELRDLLLEAGFAEVRVYFEEFDEEGDGTGNFARDEKGPACEGWLGYMVAIP